MISELFLEDSRINLSRLLVNLYLNATPFIEMLFLNQQRLESY